jgi:hypothetical protein
MAQLYDLTSPPQTQAAAPAGPQGRPGGALLSLLGRHPNLSPDFVMSIIAGLGQRLAAQQSARQAQRSGLQESLTNYAAQPGSSLEGAQAYAGAMAPQMAGRPFVGNTLESLFPGGGVSPLSPDAAPTLVDPDDKLAILDQVRTKAQLAKAGSTDPETNQIPLLHDVRQRIMQEWRFIGADPAALTEIYDLVGKAWAAEGAPVEDPGLRSSLGLEELANTQPRPSKAITENMLRIYRG